MPEANTMMFGIMALVAREAISKRTKDALAAAKLRGVKMGGFRGVLPDTKLAAEARQKDADAFAAQVGPMIHEMRQGGCSLAAIAVRLKADGIRTVRDGRWTTCWTAT